MSALPQFENYKQQWAANWLERVGRQLDLSEAQLEQARDRYESVGNWLGSSENSWLAQSTIFVHGSIGLGTGKRPVSGDEFDVDLIQRLHHATVTAAPATIKALVGDRLKEHSVYRKMLEEMPRCWRLNYANEFHLDITVAVPHSTVAAPALYIPDRHLRCWVPTNPTGFRNLFERRAALHPNLTAFDRVIKADVTEFPLHSGPKGLLRRLVQLLKHHRDLAFQGSEVSELKPISIIITTLAARAYEQVVLSGSRYQTDYDLLLAVVEHMPRFIQVNQNSPTQRYMIENETVCGENFADKWNRNSNLAIAFYDWHKRALAAFHAIAELEGQDQIAKLTSKEFGMGIGEQVLKQLKVENSTLRSAGQLSVHSAVGLLAHSKSATTQVRPNTFFGCN